MLIPKAWTAALAALGLSVATSATAAPVTYQFLMGQADISVTVGTTTLVENSTLFLDGIFAQFDSVAPALTGFQFTTAPAQTIHLSSAFGGYDDIIVESASMVPGPGFSNLFAAQMDGTVSKESTPGLRMTIRFPLEALVSDENAKRAAMSE